MLIYKNIDFNFDEKSHKYTVSKQIGDKWTVATPVTGVTTIIGIISKPALMTWPMNEAVKYLKSKTQPFSELDWKNATNAYKVKSQYGKDAGHVGHSTVEALLLGKQPEKPPEALQEACTSILNAFNKYREDFKPKNLHSEEIMYSLEHNFAGTVDDVSEIDGKTIITDYKTTNPSYYNPDGIYKEHYCQLGGYIILVEEMLGLTVDEAQVVNLPKDGSEYKIKSLSEMGLTTLDAKLYFLHALGLYKLDGLVGGRLHGQ